MLTALAAALAIATVTVPTPETTRSTLNFEIHGTPGTSGAVEKLYAVAEDRFRKLCRQIDACGSLHGPIEVWVAEDPERFAAHFPAGAPMAEWAAGVTFVGQQRMLLRAHGSALFSMLETFDHELSHVLVHAAADGRDLPRWFVEGVAIWQADESVFERLDAAHGAAASDNLLPLSSLDDAGFPREGTQVSLAYAESALFVRWLVRANGPASIGDVIARVARGEPFLSAFRVAMGASVAESEAVWASELEASSSTMAAFRDGNLWWVVMTVLLLWAGVVRLRRRKGALVTMEEEEEVADAWADLQGQRNTGQDPTLH